MTQPAPNVKPIALPEPGFPMLVIMVTDNLVPTPGDSKAAKEEAVNWAVSKPHPFVAGMRIMRMFIDRGGVEVYSMSDEGTCMRDLIPMARVRITQEAMPAEVFVEELTIAESADPDDGDDDDDTADLDVDQAPTNGPNGQVTP